MNPHDIDRHIDTALRREPDAGPPADFARNVALLARERQLAGGAVEATVERWLLRALVAVFVLAGVVVAALYGRQWLAAFEVLPMLGGATTLNWAAAMLACVGLSWALGQAGARAVR